MNRLAIMFIVQQRRNYNKAMLSTISDNLHHEIVIPSWKDTISRYLNVFSEKKVKVFHSLLRSQCPSWSTAEQINEFAHVLNAKKFQGDFALNFLQNPSMKKYNQNISVLAGKTAEYLLSKFTAIYRAEDASSRAAMPIKGKRAQFYLSRFNATVDQRSMPLGFSTKRPPDEDILCDSETCNSGSTEAVVLNCGHLFHNECLGVSGCQVCEPFLTETIDDLAKRFSASLTAAQAETQQAQQEDPSDQESDQNAELDVSDDYYATDEFIAGIKSQIAALPPKSTQPLFLSASHRKTVTLIEHNYA